MPRFAARQRVQAAATATLLFAACRAPEPSLPHTPVVDPMLSINTLIAAPPDYAVRRIGSARYPIPPYAKFLKGVRICLNPGHGGDAHKRGFKRGPTGVREAEVNLRVAKYLRAFLRAAGADVRMTRESDVELSYEQRAAIASDWGADLFVSIHHNAIDNKPQVNYTTVWYHADVDHRPSNLDLARYLCDGLYEALALPQITDVPLKSDRLMYERGFAVLRHAQVTAALTESTFFTNPQEEQRLRRPGYNLREAYGLFLGLARYAAAGLPRARLIEPADGVVRHANGAPAPDRDGDLREAAHVDSPLQTRGSASGSQSEPEAQARASLTNTNSPETATQPTSAPSPTQPQRRSTLGPTLLFELDDGLRSRKAWGHHRQMILTDTITVRIDGQVVPHEFHDDGERYRLTVPLPDDLEPGEHGVEVQFMNMNKNSVLNPHFVIDVT